MFIGKHYWLKVAIALSGTLSTGVLQAEEKDWDFYVDQIDPYSNASNESVPVQPAPKRSAAEPKANSPAPKSGTPTSPGFVLPGERVQVGSDALLSSLSTVRKQITESGQKGFSQGEAALESGFNLRPTNSFKAQKTSFSWGSKEPGYRYEDWEFVFDATNAEHAEQIMGKMSVMVQRGWEAHMSSGEQEDFESGKPNVSTTRIRFRRDARRPASTGVGFYGGS